MPIDDEDCIHSGQLSSPTSRLSKSATCRIFRERGVDSPLLVVAKLPRTYTHGIPPSLDLITTESPIPNRQSTH